jgi:predicted DNA-binding ribbon-helix-helix protein
MFAKNKSEPASPHTTGATRTLTWPGNPPRRATFHFDTATWAAVDQIAAAQGMRWSQWVHELLEQHPGAVNMRSVVRAAVVQELLDNSMFSLVAERAEQLAEPAPALLACAAVMDAEQLAEDLAASTPDGAPVDLVTHSVQTGTDPHGCACIWVRSHVEGGAHYAIPLQTTIAEQSARLAGSDWRKSKGAA